MKITRIDMNKTQDKKVDIVDIEANGTRFRLTESFGKLNINIEGTMAIKPCYANVIELYKEDR